MFFCVGVGVGVDCMVQLFCMCVCYKQLFSYVFARGFSPYKNTRIKVFPLGFSLEVVGHYLLNVLFYHPTLDMCMYLFWLAVLTGLWT